MTDAVEKGILDGQDLFNQGRYFESHERFEDAWRAARGDERLAIQGLVQAAAGCHKLGTGSLSGALELLDHCAEKLERTGSLRGQPLAPFAAQVRRAAESARRGDPGPARALRLRVLS